MATRSRRKSRIFINLSLVGGAVLLAVLLSMVYPLASVQAATVQSPYSYGDADQDGDVDAADFSTVRQIVLGKSLVVPSADADVDGDVDSADFSMVRQIAMEKASVTARYDAEYDFSTGAGTNRWAKSKSLTDMPPLLSGTFDVEPAGWVEATAEQYLNISEEHTTSWTIDASSYAALQCKFTIDEKEDAGDITSIGVYFNGSSEVDGGTLKFWVWNFVDSGWNQIGSGVTLGTACQSYHSGWTNWGKVFSDYIDFAGKMYVLLVNTDSGSDLHVNYIRLEIATPTAFVAPTPTETVVPTKMPTATPTATGTVVPTPTATVTTMPTVTPTPEYCQGTYNYVGVTTSSGPHEAYYCAIRNMPPPRWLWYWFRTEASDSEYMAVAASDDARWQTPNPGMYYRALVTFEMVIEEAPDSVNRIDLVFEGYGETGSDFEIWAYNYVTQKGQRVGEKLYIPAGSDSTMVRSITYNCGDYISPDGKVIWGVYQKATTHHWFTDGYWMAIDYVELVTTYDCP